jgi:hypothetical protein
MNHIEGRLKAEERGHLLLCWLSTGTRKVLVHGCGNIARHMNHVTTRAASAARLTTSGTANRAGGRVIDRFTDYTGIREDLL